VKVNPITTRFNKAGKPRQSVTEGAASSRISRHLQRHLGHRGLLRQKGGAFSSSISPRSVPNLGAIQVSLSRLGVHVAIDDDILRSSVGEHGLLTPVFFRPRDTVGKINQISVVLGTLSNDTFSA